LKSNPELAEQANGVSTVLEIEFGQTPYRLVGSQ